MTARNGLSAAVLLALLLSPLRVPGDERGRAILDAMDRAMNFSEGRMRLRIEDHKANGSTRVYVAEVLYVLNAFENVELPLLALGVPRTERRRMVAEILDRVGLTECVRQKPDELSGGQRQRVAIARALVISPRLVLADEPTANLDGENGRAIMEMMHEINHELSSTFLLATHDPRVLPWLDRRVYLEDGRIDRIEELPGRPGSRPRGARFLPFLVLVLSAPTGLAALSAEGSLLIQTGPAVLRPDLSPGSVPDWTAQLLASTRITGSGPAAELAIEGLFAHDAVAGAGALFLEEAWAAWKPVDGFAVRLGRQRVGFGCGFAWSVVDDLDPQPMPFEPHNPRVGLDAIRISMDLSPVGAPLQASVEGFAPRGAGAAPFLVVQGASPSLPSGILGAGPSLPGLGDCGAAAQVSAFLGGIEVGAAGSLRELASSDPPFSVGGWATVDIGGFVFGAEGAWRQDGAEWLANCSRRMGDFAAMAEARWIPGAAARASCSFRRRSFRGGSCPTASAR